jgi:hypothetical protein
LEVFFDLRGLFSSNISGSRSSSDDTGIELADSVDEERRDVEESRPEEEYPFMLTDICDGGGGLGGLGFEDDTVLALAGGGRVFGGGPLFVFASVDISSFCCGFCSRLKFCQGCN